jgi:dTDP-4-dehydrorhamnose 3,5-epimerase
MFMKTQINLINGVEYFLPKYSEDDRGSFTKAYSALWSETPAQTAAEIFYSNSQKGVLRGMHLQVNESSNARIVSIISGSVLDVLIDLRPESETFLNINICALGTNSYSSVLVPNGVAHGFQAIEPSLTLYVSSSTYKFENDTGIDATSIGVNWPIESPLRSPRDQDLPTLQEWLSIDIR